MLTVSFENNKKNETKKSLGFTNTFLLSMAVVAVGFNLFAVVLAGYSIYSGYDGSMTWLATILVAIWTFLGILAPFVVNKSKAENTEGGVVYEAMKQSGEEGSTNSPAI